MKNPAKNANSALKVCLKYMGNTGKVDINEIPGYQLNRLIDTLVEYRELKIAEVSAFYTQPRQ